MNSFMIPPPPPHRYFKFIYSYYKLLDEIYLNIYEKLCPITEYHAKQHGSLIRLFKQSRQKFL